MIEPIPNLDPGMFKLVLEERAQTRPEAKKLKPEQFFDDSVVKESYEQLIKDGCDMDTIQ